MKIVSNVEQCNCDVVNEASELLAVFKTITNKETQRNDIMRKTNKFFEVPNFRFHSKVKGFGKKVAVRKARRAGKVRV